MEKHNFERAPLLNIETIKGPNGCEVSFCGERGGIITSLKLNGKEILFLDEETFRNIEVNVKGGVPVLFPNAGPLDKNTEFPDLAQHGFARNCKWNMQKIENGFRLLLSSNEETKKMYSYDFQLSIEGKFESDGSFTLNQEVKNREEEKEMPIAMGLHPYFKVSNEEKKNIKFNFEGGEYAEEQVETWSNGKAISIDNPKFKDKDAILKVFIPDLGEFVMDVSEEFEKIWIWSMPGKDFVCIEPVMRDPNGLLDNPKLIGPKETFRASVNFKLKEI